MITFDLECGEGHVFEGWFDSLDAFEEQHKRKMVRCPYCDDSNVRRVMSPVAVKRSHQEKPVESSPIDYQRLAKEVVDYVHKHFEDVGPGFAAEALKMHYGVADKRNIRGSATSEEEKTLKDEGIEFFKLPIPKKKGEETN
jgi:hypothetical protein